MVKVVGVVEVGATHVRTTTLVMGKAKEKNNIMRVPRADGSGCIFLVFLLQGFTT